MKYAQIDGQVNSTEVPKEFKALEFLLPDRGKIASTDLTCKSKPGFKPNTTVEGYWNINKGDKGDIVNALQEVPMKKAFELISGRKLIYSSGYPDPKNKMGILHFTLISEFGWEYLV